MKATAFYAEETQTACSESKALSANDWTFHGQPTRDLTHCYHDYPARMIPQIARRLLDLFGSEARTLFDPYCGTGTSLVEGRVRGLNVVGTDLNPLARLIAIAKTTIVDEGALSNGLKRWHECLSDPDFVVEPVTSLAGIERLDYWFKPDVVEKLARIKEFVRTIDDEPTRLFFQVAFSETVRTCSNTRNNEFKLYRMPADKLETFAPDVYGVFGATLKRNQAGLHAFSCQMKKLLVAPLVQVHGFNTVDGVPAQVIAPGSADLVITSPPYGDSHTTVAYGQYSRLSAAWLNLPEPGQVDKNLMGGKTGRHIPVMASEKLNEALCAIGEVDLKRSREVASFYADLEASIRNVATVLRPGAYACYVVGNRKVKGTILPTDDAVRCAFEAEKCAYVDTFVRAIPNKRMPLKNSPTNAAGATDATMTREFIVVARKR